MKKHLLLTSALFSTAMIFGAPLASAQIVTTTVTSYSYGFPSDSSPSVSRSSSTTNSCGGGTDSACIGSACHHDSGGSTGGGGGTATGPSGQYGGADGVSHDDAPGTGATGPAGTPGGQPSTGATGTGNGSSGGSGSKVICTYFYQKGEMDEMLYFADIENSKTNVHPITLRGYHAWAVWYVTQIRKNPGGWMEKLIRPVALHRANEIGYQMGVSDKPDYLGKLFRLLVEYPGFIIGLFTPGSDWKKLYNAEDFKSFAQGWRRYQAYKNMLAGRAVYRLQYDIRRTYSSSHTIYTPYQSLIAP